MAFPVVEGTLPLGLTLDGETGVLAGAPQQSGIWSFTVRVRDASFVAGSRAYSLTVYGPRLIITGLTPPQTDVGSAPFAVTVTGADFVNGATVFWNGRATPKRLSVQQN